MAKRMLTLKQAADRLGIPAVTVRLWARQDRIPGAIQVATPRGPYWEIPETSLKLLKHRPKRGRPKGAKSKKVKHGRAKI